MKFNKEDFPALGGPKTQTDKCLESRGETKLGKLTSDKASLGI